MKDKSVQKIVTELIEPYLKLGMELVHLEYRAGNRGSLTIYIDKPGGVTIGDCEKQARYFRFARCLRSDPASLHAGGIFARS